ncbi:MarR family winged helix-turn-helix transcriptional regulator [Salinicoccus sp. HZC-1]|uniref:MarR family winged helix-turn-helix transcriptional regulator n=1 Tax=Salinicoccus sp. HZC-1 TaxID=3385497 RepID=UPI00398AA8BB
MNSRKKFFYAFTSAYRPYINRLDRELAPFNLFSSQWRIMIYLKENGPHTISEIAGESNVEKPTTTRLVQKLHESGYVKSVQGEDKRVRMIELTPRGHAVYKEVREKLDVFYSYLLDDMGDEEQKQLTELMNRISKRIKEY